MTKPQYALSHDDLGKELRAIDKCWEILSNLDTQARERALQWLHNWISAERPRNSDGDYL